MCYTRRDTLLTHLDWHARTMEAVREQHPLPQHPLVSRCKLNLGNRESMSEVQGAVHVGVWKVAEPFGELLLDLDPGEALRLLEGRGIDLKDAFVLPPLLVFLL